MKQLADLCSDWLEAFADLALSWSPFRWRHQLSWCLIVWKHQMTWILIGWKRADLVSDWLEALAEPATDFLEALAGSPVLPVLLWLEGLAELASDWLGNSGWPSPWRPSSSGWPGLWLTDCWPGFWWTGSTAWWRRCTPGRCPAPCPGWTRTQRGGHSNVPPAPLWDDQQFLIYEILLNNRKKIFCYTVEK